jgi:undecaprenyl-diphosphatase
MAGLLSVLLLKHLFRRERPGTGHFLYGPGVDQHSFPSGHGSRAGVILVWSSLLLGRWRWLAPFLALWIGWSRVALAIHYLGDVLVGFGLGIALARWVKRITN